MVNLQGYYIHFLAIIQGYYQCDFLQLLTLLCSILVRIVTFFVTIKPLQEEREYPCGHKESIFD